DNANYRAYGGLAACTYNATHGTAGGGGGGGNTTWGGYGGDGGAAVWIVAPEMTILGDIVVDGVDGTTGLCDGGGGGAGGMILLQACRSLATSVATTDLLAQGGTGGAGITSCVDGASGGGGGGGEIYVWYPSGSTAPEYEYTVAGGVRGSPADR